MEAWNALEIVRPWLTTGFIAGILAILARLYVENRRLRLAEKTRDQDYRLQVSDDGRNNLQFVIDNLVRDITAQREATAEQADAHERCEKELRELRDENRGQGKKLDGLSAQFISFQRSVAQAIPPGNWSPEISHMMGQLDALAAVARGSD